VPNKVVSLSLSVLLLAGMVLLVFHPKSVESTSLDWWNPDWVHRKQIVITEKSGYDLTDFPVEVTFEHNGHVESDGKDIRAIDNGTEIPYCITSLNSSFASVMFEINLTSFSAKNIYVYYGNPSVSKPSYPLVPLEIVEGNTGHAIIDDRIYIGWDYTSWGWSNPVELWNDFRIDFNGNNDPTDDSDLIRDYGSRQGGIARHRADTSAIGLGDYQSYVQTAIYVDVIFADARLRVYRNNPWVETTQADFLHMFSPSYTHANYHGGTEQNLIDGEGTNLWGVDSGTWVYNSKENPSWMAFRDSSSGYVLASTGFGIGSNYSYFQGGKEASDWDRVINYCNKTRWEPVEPYDQPLDCRIYWYGDNSNSYTEIQKIAATLNNQPMVTIVPDTIIVPNDFLSIQEAINHANEGDTVFVRNGTYFGSVVVDRSISLVGENNQSTIIDGEGYRTVLKVIANNVEVTRFTIRNGWEYDNCGIYVNSSGNLVSENIVAGNFYGCRFWVSANNSLLGNRISNNVYGIRLDSSPNNDISGNSITENYDYGISLQTSPTSTVSGNNIADNRRSIFLYECSGTIISGNNVVANSEYGVCLSYSRNVSILGNNITGYGGGSEAYGICLFSGAKMNRIIENNIANNLYGIGLRDWSDLNNISGNMISANYFGILVDWSGGNFIHHNNIVNNVNQASINGDVGNSWDNGCEGNYWSDYSGSDGNGDGIGDSQYVIDATNIDHYPLMNPYWNPADINHDLKIDVKDIYIVAKSYGTTSTGPNPEGCEWNPHCDINEDGKINMKDYYPVCKNYGKTYP